MSQGTYSGSSTYVSLTAAITTVTFTADSVVESTTGDAVRGGALNAYTLFNYGSIVGTSDGVFLGDGGAITNGSPTNTDALIQGTYGINIAGAPGTIVNFGTIEGAAGADSAIHLQNYADAGAVTNGSLADTGALIEGYVGIGFQEGLTLTNYGSITGNFAGIDGRTGTIVNGSATDTSALIRGAFGVDDIGGNSKLSNFATIEGGSAVYAYAVDFGGGTDTITNGSGGDTAALISGGSGIRLGTVTSGTVVNYGTIRSTANGAVTGGTTSHGIGVYLVGGGSVTNETGGTIAALANFGIGIELDAAGTVTNAGTIEGSEDSVLFGSSGDLLIAQSGADFLGLMAGGGGTLELADGIGTLTGLGSTGTLSLADSGTFSGFGSYVIGMAGTWTLDGANTIGSDQGLTVDGILIDTGTLVMDGALSGTGTIVVANGGTVDLASSVPAGTIDFIDATGVLSLASPADVTLAVEGFTHGDQIDLTGIAYDTGHMRAEAANGQIYVFDGATQIADLHLSGVTGRLEVQQDAGSGTEITAVCFVAGTRILTARGEVAIEALRPGDLVVSVGTGAPVPRPVRWIGRRRLDASRHARPDKVYPIRICRDAIGPGRPHRDLLVSPAHALFLDGMMVPAEALVNGLTIRPDRSRALLDYYHLELDGHDAVLADGLPAETYLDCGNRGFFENGGAPVGLHAVPDAGAAYQSALAQRGPALVALRQRIIDRLEGLGCRIGRLPELRLAVDGHLLDPARIESDRHRFVLPARYRDLRLVSAMGALAWTRADSFDRRLLGVSVLAIDWVEQGVTHRLDLADASLFADGWHGLDGRGARAWRWTDGNARLAIANAASVEVTLGTAVTRWLPPADPAVARNRSTA